MVRLTKIQAMVLVASDIDVSTEYFVAIQVELKVFVSLSDYYVLSCVTNFAILKKYTSTGLSVLCRDVTVKSTSYKNHLLDIV